MGFNFIPYRLNADMTDFNDDIQYVNSDNGIDLYKARKELIKSLLNIPVSEINLYFYEGRLITVYIHLATIPENAVQVLNIQATSLEMQNTALKTDLGTVYTWVIDTELLGLVNDEKDKKLYLYYSLKEFSVL